MSFKIWLLFKYTTGTMVQYLLKGNNLQSDQLKRNTVECISQYIVIDLKKHLQKKTSSNKIKMSLRELLSKIVIIGLLCTWQANGQLQSATFAQSQASACVPSSVEKFSATFYSSLLAEHGNDINFGVQLPGPTAAALVYKVIIEELSNRGIPNVEKVAEISRGGLAKLKIFSLPVYFQRSGHAIGTLLLQEGYLNCFNAELLALQLFKYVDSVLHVLDLTNIESYLRARIRGTAEFSDSIGYTDVYRSEKLATILAAELS